MISIQNVVTRLNRLVNIPEDALVLPSIQACFEDYSFEGETELILSPLPLNNDSFIIDDEFIPKPGEYIACVNRIGSPEISFWINANDVGSYSILNPQIVREQSVKVVS